ncbi:MAG: protein phosphatase 2C domain-containing protein [Rhodospirillales bacterium]|nr:protein phosphatase 2C domain-containing protein [Rhodospirillales bacterium]
MAVIDMRVTASWHSQQGKRTEDNRDYCGVGLRADAALFIVLDGSTSGQRSGELARQIAREFIDWFIDDALDVTADILTEKLRKIHETLSSKFSADSASYVIAYIEDEKPVLVLHAGDCLLGQYDGENPVQWQTRPHTLANITEEIPIAELVKYPARNLLVRSFRSSEFMPPEVTGIEPAASHSLILATDGFWAELDAGQQFSFLDGHAPPIEDDGDDRSALQITFLDKGQNSKAECKKDSALENFYLKTSS